MVVPLQPQSTTEVPQLPPERRSVDINVSAFIDLKTLYNELSSRNINFQLNHTMKTATLASRLKSVMKDVETNNSFEILNKAFLSSNLVLTPLFQSIEKSDSKQSYKSFLIALGGQFSIKGSSIKKIEKNTLLDSKNKQSDADIYIQLNQIDKNYIFKRLGKAIQQGLPHLSELSYEQLAQLYTLSHVPGENSYKVRMHVKQDESIALDIFFYTQLWAGFDRLRGSDLMTINLHDRMSQTHKLISDETDEWLDKGHLIWLNEDMPNGLVRAQKHYSKDTTLKTLNPPSIELLYAQASNEQKMNFMKWAHRAIIPNAPIELKHEIFLTLAQSILNYDGGSKIFNQFKNVLLHHANSKENPLNSPETCFEVFKPFERVYRAFLNTPFHLPSAAVIGKLFDKEPELLELSNHWNHAIQTQNVQIQMILAPMTLKKLSELFDSQSPQSQLQKPNLFAQASELLLNLTRLNQCPEQVLALFDLRLKYLEIGPQDKKNMMTELLSIEKGSPAFSKLNRARFDLLSRLTPDTEVIDRIKTNFPEILNVPFEEFVTQDNYSHSAKALLLYCHLDKQLSKLDQLNQAIEAGILSTNAFDQHQLLSNTFEELQTLTQIFPLEDLNHIIPGTHRAVSIDQAHGDLLKLSEANSCLLTKDWIQFGKQETQSQSNTEDSNSREQGLRYGYGTIIKGNFSNHTIDDDHAQVWQKTAHFRGQVHQNTLGYGILQRFNDKLLGELLKELPKVFKEILPPSKKKPYQIKGSFAPYAFNEIGHIPSLRLSTTQINLPSNRFDFRLHCLEGNITSLSMDNFGPSETASLVIPVEVPNGSSLTPSLSKVDFHNHDKQLFISGPYDTKAQCISGQGQITSLEDAELIFQGALSESQAHGYGISYSKQTPEGKLSFYEHGKISDQETLSFARQYQKRTPRVVSGSAQLSHYYIPKQDEVSFFSCLNESGDKLFGLWNYGTVDGVLKLKDHNNYESLEGTFIAVPKIIFDETKDMIDFEYQSFAEFSNPKQNPYCILPIGTHKTKNHQGHLENKSFCFGKEIDYPFTTDKRGTFFAKVDPKGTKRSISKKLPSGYIHLVGEHKLSKKKRNHQYMPHGKVVTFEKGILYSGTFDKGDKHGKGFSAGPEGLIYRGTYDRNAYKFGQLKLTSGVKLTGSFQSGEPNGACQIEIPAFPNHRKFRVNIQNNQLVGDIIEQINGIHQPTTLMATLSPFGAPTWTDLILHVNNESIMAITVNSSTGGETQMTDEFQKLMRLHGNIVMIPDQLDEDAFDEMSLADLAHLI